MSSKKEKEVLDKKRLLAAALRKKEKMALSKAFDPSVPSSRPNEKQWEILRDIGKVQQRVVKAGNQSGKSQLAARELAWILNRDHPTWKIPDAWGDDGLTIIIAGQSRKHMTLELWENKLSKFLDLSQWKSNSPGGVLESVKNTKTGDKIIFVSHSDSSENNRKHMQGFVAHYVWLDEMPGSFKILDELQRRVDARGGYLMATFTPKFRNDEIKKIIDAGVEPIMKTYSMSKLDNPLYADRIEEELAKMEGYAENYKKAVLYGDWYSGDSSVYEWKDEMEEALPPAYSKSWRHVVSIDPATNSKFGYTLWAENPGTGVWYLVRGDYIEGIYDPNEQADELIARERGYNIVRRISDVAAWLTALLAKRGYIYMNPYSKTTRKDELIKNLQRALSEGTIKIPPHNELFRSEVQNCQWSERAVNKMVNSSSYHILDSAQYFVDCKPPFEAGAVNRSWEEQLHEEHMENKKKRALVQRAGRVKSRGWGQRRRSRRSII